VRVYIKNCFSDNTGRHGQTSNANKENNPPLPYVITPTIHDKSLKVAGYRVGCPRGTSILKAGLDITATTDFSMNARWAYYVSGTIVPLDIHRTYAYLGNILHLVSLRTC
jgi:hypothetical protein